MIIYQELFLLATTPRDYDCGFADDSIVFLLLLLDIQPYDNYNKHNNNIALSSFYLDVVENLDKLNFSNIYECRGSVMCTKKCKQHIMQNNQLLLDSLSKV